MPPPTPIRILFIAPSLEIVGGQAVQASQLLEHLRRDPALDVVFLPNNPSIPPVLRGIKYVRTLVNCFVYLTLLLRKVFSCDLIHVFTAAGSSYLLWTVPAIVLGRLAGRAVLVHYHDGRAEGHLANWPCAVRTLKWANAIVTPSGYLVDVFRRYRIEAVAIYNITDVARFPFRERDPLRPVFMTNRGLEPLYNVGCLIRAFASIQARIPSASLTIAHDGPCRAGLETLVRTLELRHVRFVGTIPQSQIPDLYHETDIYLMSPNFDNMPGSVLECFAAGVPVIATRAGGVPYIVTHGQTGLLVDCDDHEEMARCGLKLLDDPELARNIVRQARQECEKYSWPAVREQWIGLYQRLAGSANGPAGHSVRDL